MRRGTLGDRSRAAGVTLDGLAPAEGVRDTVLTVVRAGLERSAPRDVASTRAGTAAFRLARHAPGLLDRVVAARLRLLVRAPGPEGAGLAAGLRQRHGVRPSRLDGPASARARGRRAARA